MMHGKTANTFSHTANHRGCANEAGFSFLEVLVALAILAIMSGFAAFGMRNIREGMQANQAMYQVAESLRNARMLAMSERRMVLVQFPMDDEIEMKIQLNDDSEEAGCSEWWSVLGNCWDEIGGADSVLSMPLGSNPSIKLENGYKFTRRGSDGGGYDLGDTPDEELGSAHGDIVFGGIAITPGTTATFVFTTDGFLTTTNDFFHPINGTIFIGDGKNESRARAVTILGATGRVNTWRWKNGWKSGL